MKPLFKKIGLILFPVIFALILLSVYSPSTAQVASTNTPFLTETLPPTISHETLILFTSPYSLTLLVSAPYSISLLDLQFVYNGRENLIFKELKTLFSDLTLTNGVMAAGTCIVLTRATNPEPPPSDCKNLIFRVILPEADAFWYDSVSNGLRNFNVNANVVYIRTCSTTPPNCSIPYPTMTPSPTPMVFVSNTPTVTPTPTPTPTASDTPTPTPTSAPGTSCAAKRIQGTTIAINDSRIANGEKFYIYPGRRVGGDAVYEISNGDVVRVDEVVCNSGEPLFRLTVTSYTSARLIKPNEVNRQGQPIGWTDQRWYLGLN